MNSVGRCWWKAVLYSGLIDSPVTPCVTCLPIRLINLSLFSCSGRGAHQFNWTRCVCAAGYICGWHPAGCWLYVSVCGMEGSSRPHRASSLDRRHCFITVFLSSLNTIIKPVFYELEGVIQSNSCTVQIVTYLLQLPSSLFEVYNDHVNCWRYQPSMHSRFSVMVTRQVVQ